MSYILGTFDWRQLLVHNGQILARNLRAELITRDDLRQRLRERVSMTFARSRSATWRVTAR